MFCINLKSLNSDGGSKIVANYLYKMTINLQQSTFKLGMNRIIAESCPWLMFLRSNNMEGNRNYLVQLFVLVKLEKS